MEKLPVRFSIGDSDDQQTDTVSRETKKECPLKRLNKEKPTQELLIRAGFAALPSAGRSRRL